MPFLSVVIPTFNRAGYLQQALDSVLAQRDADFEVIVSDNCSEDDTPALLERYRGHPRLRCFRNNENIGMVRNWHKAIFEHAQGDWFLLLSDDDYLIDPLYLAKVQQLITAHPKLVLVYAEGYLQNAQTGEQRALHLPFEGCVDGAEVFASRGTVAPQDFTLCNVVFPRQRARELNAFANPHNLSCDSELFLKLAASGDVGVIRACVSVYRFHASNLIHTVNRSPELAYANLDHLLEPYRFAKDRIPAQQLAAYVAHTRLLRRTLTGLLMIACLDHAAYRQARQDLLLRFPELLGPALCSLRHRSLAGLARHAGRGVLPLYLKLQQLWLRCKA